MLALERDEVDEDVDPAAECLAQGVSVGAVDADVLDPWRQLALATAADHDVPAALPEPRDQSAPRLTAAPEEKGMPSH